MVSSDRIYTIGQEGVNTIYKALKMMLTNQYSEIDVTHIDKQTARAIIKTIDEHRDKPSGSETETKPEKEH